MSKFKIGQVVKHKSNNKRMVVIIAANNSKFYYCRWLEKGKYIKEGFEEFELELEPKMEVKFIDYKKEELKPVAPSESPGTAIPFGEQSANFIKKK